MTLKIHVDRSWAKRGWDVYILEDQGTTMSIYRPDGDWWTAEALPAPFTKDPGAPSLFLRDEWATALTEVLMIHGVRPDIEARNEGELKAMSAHLADLQMLLELRLKPSRKELPCSPTNPTLPSR